MPVADKFPDTLRKPYKLFEPLALKSNLFPLLASVMLSALPTAAIVKSWWFVSSKISVGSVLIFLYYQLL